MTHPIKAASTCLSRALCVLGLAVLALGTNLAEAATPNSFFGSALVTGTNNRITVTRVPVIDSAGVVTYKDVTLNFVVSTTGVLTLAPSTITPSPALITSGFRAGNYKDTSGNKYVVSGPSVIPGTARTTWSLAGLTLRGINRPQWEAVAVLRASSD